MKVGEGILSSVAARKCIQCMEIKDLNSQHLLEVDSL